MDTISQRFNEVSQGLGEVKILVGKQNIILTTMIRLTPELKTKNNNIENDIA